MSKNSIRENNRERGFSLVEALVALGVFALAGVGLVQLQTQSLTTLSDAEQRALADLIAQNQMVDVAGMSAPPVIGVTQGHEELAYRQWTWIRQVDATPDANTLRVIVTVSPSEGATPLARVVAFVPSATSPAR